MHVPGSGHPFELNPPGQYIWSEGQTIGHMAGHLEPSSSEDYEIKEKLVQFIINALLKISKWKAWQLLGV